MMYNEKLNVPIQRKTAASDPLYSVGRVRMSKRNEAKAKAQSWNATYDEAKYKAQPAQRRARLVRLKAARRREERHLILEDARRLDLRDQNTQIPGGVIG